MAHRHRLLHRHLLAVCLAAAMILSLLAPGAASADSAGADGPAPPSALAAQTCEGSSVAFCSGVMDAASTLTTISDGAPAEARETIAADAAQAKGVCASDATGCAEAAGNLTFSSGGYRNHQYINGPQLTIAATHVYGQGGASGAPISCFVGVATGTPYFYRGDSRTITYSGSVWCPSGGKNVVTMSITEVSLKDAVTNATLAGAPQYGPYVIEKEGGTTGGNYTRVRNTQTQYIKVQAYLDLNSHQWGGNGWHVVPPACTKVSQWRVRCDFNSGAFGFVPTTGPGSDDLVSFFDGLYDQGDYETDIAIDTMLGAGEPYTSIADALIGNTAGSAINSVLAPTYGIFDLIPVLGDVAKCVVALGKFAADNAFVIAKIRKAGGFIKVAKKIIKSKNPREVLEKLAQGAGELVGVDAVIRGCAGGRRGAVPAPAG